MRVDVLDGMEDKRLNQDISDYTTFYTRENTKAFNLRIKTSKDSYSYLLHFNSQKLFNQILCLKIASFIPSLVCKSNKQTLNQKQTRFMNI